MGVSFGFVSALGAGIGDGALGDVPNGEGAGFDAVDGRDICSRLFFGRNSGSSNGLRHISRGPSRLGSRLPYADDDCTGAAISGGGCASGADGRVGAVVCAGGRVGTVWGAGSADGGADGRVGAAGCAGGAGEGADGPPPISDCRSLSSNPFRLGTLPPVYFL